MYIERNIKLSVNLSDIHNSFDKPIIQELVCTRLRPKQIQQLKEIAEKSVFVLNKSNAQSIPSLQSSGALGNCEVRANIAITPVFADLKNLLHSGNMVLQVMAKVIETI